MFPRLLFFLCLCVSLVPAFPSSSHAFEVSDAGHGYSFELPWGWNPAPETVLKDLRTKKGAKTSFVESYVVHDREGEISAVVSVYVNNGGKFDSETVKADMDRYAREDTERKRAVAASRNKVFRAGFEFDEYRTSAVIHYSIGEYQLHKYYFFTTTGYVYVTLGGEDEDRIESVRPYLEGLKLDDSVAFNGGSLLDWEGLLMGDWIFWIVIGVVVFLKVKKWIMRREEEVREEKAGRRASGWEKLRQAEQKLRRKTATEEAVSMPSESSLDIHEEKISAMEEAEARRVKPKAIRKPKAPKARQPKERGKMPKRFGREEREAKMDKAQYSVGKHLARRKYLKGYK